MSSRDIGRMRVVLAAETERFNKSMEKSRKQTARLGKEMKKSKRGAEGMGAAMSKLAAIAGPALAGRALLNLGRQSIALGDEIAKTSRRLGLGIEALQALQIEGKAAGIETEALHKALTKFGVGIGEVAALGTGEFKPTLERLNIELFDMHGNVRSIDDLLPEFARKLGQVGSDAERLAFAADAFGQRGLKIIELLPLIAKGMDAVSLSSQKMGGIIGADQVLALEQTQDALDRMGKAWDGFWAQRFGSLAVTLGFGSVAAELRQIIAELERLPQIGEVPTKLADARERLRLSRLAPIPGLGGGPLEPRFLPPTQGPQIAPHANMRPDIGPGAALLGEEFASGIAWPGMDFGETSGFAEWSADLEAANFERQKFTDGLSEMPPAFVEADEKFQTFATNLMSDGDLMQASIFGLSDGISSGLASALISGEANFKEFASSILQSIGEMIAKQLILRALMSALPGLFPAAKGAVVPGGVEKFASGGVVDRPTLFSMGGSFGGGVGLMAEAGMPEAIMPLRRDSSGRLGVSASGGSSGSSGPGSVVVNVTNNASNSRENDEKLGRVIAAQVRSAWNAEARRQMRPGGTLNPIGANV